MKRWSLLLVVAGCNKFFDITEVGPLPDSAPADSMPDAEKFMCPEPLLVDEFKTGPTCAPWGVYATAGSVTPTEGNMMLRFDLSNLGEAQCHSAAGTGIAVPQGGLMVQAAQVPDGLDSYMSLESTVLDLEVYESNGTLIFRRPSNSAVFGMIPYDAIAMQFWRIDPHPTLVATASYSSDAMTWTEFGTGSYAPPQGPVDIHIKAGAPKVTGPETAIFQHLLACP